MVYVTYFAVDTQPNMVTAGQDCKGEKVITLFHKSIVSQLLNKIHVAETSRRWHVHRTHIVAHRASSIARRVVL